MDRQLLGISKGFLMFVSQFPITYVRASVRYPSVPTIPEPAMISTGCVTSRLAKATWSIAAIRSSRAARAAIPASTRRTAVPAREARSRAAAVVPATRMWTRCPPRRMTRRIWSHHHRRVIVSSCSAMPAWARPHSLISS